MNTCINRPVLIYVIEYGKSCIKLFVIGVRSSNSQIHSSRIIHYISGVRSTSIFSAHQIKLFTRIGRYLRGSVTSGVRSGILLEEAPLVLSECGEWYRYQWWSARESIETKLQPTHHPLIQILLFIKNCLTLITIFILIIISSYWLSRRLTL